MSEMFDKKLIRRLAEVFDNHQETFDKGAWRDMEERLKKEGKAGKNYSSFIIRAAAIILLLILLFVPIHQKITKQESEKLSGGFTDQNLPAGTIQQQESSQGEIKTGYDKTEQKQESEDEITKNQINLASIQAEPGIRQEVLKNTGAGINKKEMIKENRLSKMSTRIEGLHAGTAEKNTIGNLPDFNRKTKSEWPIAIAEESDQKNFSFSVSLSSLYNYTPQKTKSQFNYAGGVQSDISITRNLSLNTGLIVAKQYFSTQSSQSPVLNASSESFKLSGEYYTGGEDHFELIGLDLPVNISYQFGDLTFTAGVSSMFYIQEQIFAEFNSSLSERYDLNFANNPNLVKRDNDLLYREKIRAFETLDLVSALNLSIGYSFEWHENDFLIQPYIKHPFRDMTQYDIRYGSRGLRLIYIF